jgi:hypothetical protein
VQPLLEQNVPVDRADLIGVAMVDDGSPHPMAIELVEKCLALYRTTELQATSTNANIRIEECDCGREVEVSKGDSHRCFAPIRT